MQLSCLKFQLTTEFSHLAATSPLLLHPLSH